MYFLFEKTFRDSTLIKSLNEQLNNGTLQEINSKKHLLYNVLANHLRNSNINVDTSIYINHIYNRDFTIERSLTEEIDQAPFSINVKNILKSYISATANFRASSNPDDIAYVIEIALLYENAFYNNGILSNQEKENILTFLSVDKFATYFRIQNNGDPTNLPIFSCGLLSYVGFFIGATYGGPLGGVLGASAFYYMCILFIMESGT